MSPILTNSYQLLARDGRGVTRAEIHRDINKLFRDNFAHFVHLKGSTNGHAGAA